MKATLQSSAPANVLRAPDGCNVTRYLIVAKATPFARNAFIALEWQTLTHSSSPSGNVPASVALSLIPPDHLLFLFLVLMALCIDLTCRPCDVILLLLSVAISTRGL